MYRFIRLILFTLLLMGCAAVGPTSSPEFPSLVAKAVPSEDGEIHIFGKGQWFPNLRGFTDIRSLALTQPVTPTPGILVLTDRALVFQQWDEAAKNFVIIKRLPYSEFASVSLDTYGLNRRIVLQKRDFSFDSFDFTTASNSIETKKVEQAVEFLRGRIGVNTASDG
jgi:hypothetical protein